MSSQYETLKTLFSRTTDKDEETKRKLIEMLKTNYLFLDTGENEDDKCIHARELFEIIVHNCFGNSSFKFPDSLESCSSKNFQQKFSLYFKYLNFADYVRKIESMQNLEFRSKLLQNNFYLDFATEKDFEAILNFGKGQISYYLSDFCINKEKNLKSLRDYIRSLIVFPDSLENCNKKDFLKKYSLYFRYLGFGTTRHKVINLPVLLFRKKLVENEFYSDIATEKDFEVILNFKPSEESYYLSDLSPNKEENTKKFREFIVKKILFPNCLEACYNSSFQVVNKNPSFFYYLGFGDSPSEIGRKMPSLEFKQKLVQFGFYSNDITELDLEIILNYSTSFETSYYLSDVCPKQKENKEKIKTFETFKNFLKGEMSDGSKVSPNKIKRFLQKYGFEVSTSQKKVNFRMLQAKWAPELEQKLLEMYNKDENLIEKLRNTNLAQEEFGRSAKAVISKLYELLGTRNQTGRYINYSKRAVTTFPNQTLSYLHSLVSYSQVPIELIKEEYPILSYTYPFDKQAPREESIFVFLLPIEYKGVNLDKYTQTEQVLIQYLQNELVLLNSQDFSHSCNIFEAKTPEVKEDEGLIIHPHFSLVGLYLRQKFSLNDKIETEEQHLTIPFEDNSELKLNLWILN
jgi:hypothetical protein